MLDSWLWSELHDLFDTDDGSLPEINVNYPDSSATVSGYALLRERVAQVVTENQYFWSTTRNVKLHVDSVPNPAALVVSGEADAFHVVFGGIQSGGVTIPDLGVFVSPNQITLDYRMGAEWGPSQLKALFELLEDLTRLDVNSSLCLRTPLFLKSVLDFMTPGNVGLRNVPPNG